MNLFVLSELCPGHNHVGWTVSQSLEETLASICNPTFIYPSENNSFRLFNRLNLTSNPDAPLNRYRHRLFKSWYELESLPTLNSTGPNVLLVIGLGTRFLLSMHALGPLLNKFDLKIAYVLDGFHPSHLDRTVISMLDHLFVMSAELADDINRTTTLPTSFLPLATNTATTHFNPFSRWIDVISYGRGNTDFHKQLQAHFGRLDNDRVYHHSTFSAPQVYDRREHVTLMAKLLERAKISVCFEASNIERFQGYSPILYRWFEAWAAGCAIIGKKPFGKGVAELMDWEKSAIDIPDQPSQWIPFVESLLEDEVTLRQIGQHNYRECLLRHDWRYRLVDLFTTVGLPVPNNLRLEIVNLQSKALSVGHPEIALV